MATQVYRTLAKIVGAVLLVVGIAALFGGNFAHGFVREQLVAQNITMPTAEAIDAQVASGRITEGNAVELRKYAADGPMSTGPQARAFADEYILSHMRAGAKAAGVPEEQATYSGIGEVVTAKTAQLRAELKAVPENASKTDQEIAALAAQEIANPATDFSLAKEIKSLQDLRTSTFLDGNTLRGMMKTDWPEAVQNFLDRINGPQRNKPTLSALTTEVFEWLRDEDMLEDFVITRK